MAGIDAAGEVTGAEISAIVTRADGTVEDFGTIAGFTTDDDGRRRDLGPKRSLIDRLMGRAPAAEPVSVTPAGGPPPDLFRVVLMHPSTNHPNHALVAFGDLADGLERARELEQVARETFPDYNVWTEGLTITDADGATEWKRL